MEKTFEQKFSSNVKSIFARNYMNAEIKPTLLTGVNISAVDKELSETADGLQYFHLSVAVTNAREDLEKAFGKEVKKVAPSETDFVRLTVFGSSAKHFFDKNLSAMKGSSTKVTVLAIPSKISEYTDKESKETKYSFEMVLVDLIKNGASSYFSSMSTYTNDGKRQSLALLRGHLTKALPEIKKVGKDHQVISFNLAINGDYAHQMNRASNSNIFKDIKDPDGKTQAKFVRVNVWDKYAETFAQREYTKGTEIQVLGNVSSFYNDPQKDQQLLEVNGLSVSKIATTTSKKTSDNPISDDILPVNPEDLPF